MYIPIPTVEYIHTHRTHSGVFNCDFKYYRNCDQIRQIKSCALLNVSSI